MREIGAFRKPRRTITATMARPRSALLALLLLLTIHASALAQRPTAAELDKTGWDAIRASKLQEAADAFREGLRLEPRNVRLMLGAAVAANLMGRAEEARQQLVAVLQLQPALTDASILLGQILYRDADLAGAIQVYEQALVHAPDNQILTTNLENWRKEIALHDKFTQRLRRSLHRDVRRAERGSARRQDQRDARSVLLAYRFGAWRVSQRHPHRCPLHERAISRRHALPHLGGGVIRRQNPRADARRGRESARARACAGPRVYARADLQHRSARRPAMAQRGPRPAVRTRARRPDA